MLIRADQGSDLEGSSAERSGAARAGPLVPKAILDHPDVVRQLHRDFVHAGSDVVEALTYYAHREKLRLIGRCGYAAVEPVREEGLRLR